MLASRRILVNPLTGDNIELPMLVPAFTSKGFPNKKKDGTGRSAIANALTGSQTFIKESLLVSAYDIHHGYIPKPDKYLPGKMLFFMDSGGYELAAGWDSTEPKQGKHRTRAFAEEDYRRVLSTLPDNIPTMVANFDWGSRKKKLLTQISEAKKLFADFDNRGFLSSFILKPGRQQHLVLKDVLPHLEELRSFKCIGLVEKELGKNLLDRLITVAKIRQALTERDMTLPIHIWGGLDPIATPLYFFAGADIFDGVSWLRYAYHNGVAVCRESHCVLLNDVGLGAAGEQAQAMTMAKNLFFLRRLQETLYKFVCGKGKTFAMFDELSEVKGKTLSLIFKRAYDDLSRQVPCIGGA